MADPDQPPPCGITRSSDFSWDTVVFKVESTIFSVPRRAFTESSPVFETMFLLPTGEGEREVEGGSDQNPITLEGYTAVDFDALLRVLYPTSRALLEGGVTLSKDQWIGVLGLSTIWEMGEIRELAIKNLSSASPALTPVEQVTLGRDHKIVSWFIEGLMALTWVDRQLSPDALAEAVGLRTAFRIFNARLQRSSSHAKIVPIPLPSGNRTGMAVADLRYTCCWKPFVLDNTKSCHSCSSTRIANECGSVYVETTPPLNTTSQHCYFYSEISNIRCGSCHNIFISESVICPNCNATSPAKGFHLFLGQHATLIPSPESLLREVFQDEISEYEA